MQAVWLVLTILGIVLLIILLRLADQFIKSSPKSEKNAVEKIEATKKIIVKEVTALPETPPCCDDAKEIRADAAEKKADDAASARANAKDESAEIDARPARPRISNANRMREYYAQRWGGSMEFTVMDIDTNPNSSRGGINTDSSGTTVHLTDAEIRKLAALKDLFDRK